MLKTMFGPKREEIRVTTDRRALYNEELYVYLAPFAKYYYCEQIKDNERVGACAMHGSFEKCMYFRQARI
jgi:hypothetical protein